MSRVSLASRIALFAACAVGAAVAIAALATYLTLRSQLHGRLDDHLLTRANAAAQSSLVENATLSNVPSDVLGAADLHIFLYTAQGSVTSANKNELSWVKPVTHQELQVALGRRARSFRTVTVHESDGDTVDYRAVSVPASPGVALMFMQSEESIEATLDRMGLVLFLVGVGGIVVSGVSGLLVARQALRPVRRLSAAAEHIARTEELTPIEVSGDDELASLATSFNGMLAALGSSRDRQRRLVADAGHELRTPLTSLRTNLELMAQADRQGGMSTDDRNEIFADATAQVEELSTLVGDLVELARDEPMERTPEPIDLADVVERTVERVRRRAPTVEFDVDAHTWWVVGEEQVIERAVTNLLDNAAKWSPPDSTVTVRLRSGQLTVADEGPGIPEADLPMIFERFYRAADARTMPGSGLGLSIVAQAAERHLGSIRARNIDPHGAEFTLTLPGGPEMPRRQTTAQSQAQDAAPDRGPAPQPEPEPATGRPTWPPPQAAPRYFGSE